MPAASHPSHDRFATTRWSMVMKLAGEHASDAQGALAELAQRYWYPVYAYVRRCGHPPEVAHDITRAFLGQLTRRFRETHERPPPGHFRRYLLNELNTFLAGDWRAVIRSAVGDALQPPPDLEMRNQRDNAAAASPEQAYQRSFALEVLARALRRLQAEANQTGHLAMYESLQPYLSHDPGPGDYQAVATRLKMPPLALVVALKRLRQRFRELAGQELSDTVTSAEDLMKEQATLLAVLRDIQNPAS